MAGTVLELVLDRGRLRYRVDGRTRRRRDGESLSELCRRFGASAVVLPAGPRWPPRLAELVATVATDPLPPAVADVSTAGLRLRLDDAAATSAWRYVVDGVARRLQAQSSISTGSPGAGWPASTAASAGPKSPKVPSGRRTASRAGQPQSVPPLFASGVSRPARTGRRRAPSASTS